MITFETKQQAEQFTKELQTYLDKEFNPSLYTEYVKLNKGPEYDFSLLSSKQMDVLLNTPSTKEPYENIVVERFNEVAIEMFLLSNPK
jgi:hypothetical protein